jgi:cytochrome b561
MPAAPPRYARPAIVLHWAMAVLIVAGIVLGLSADYVPDDWARPVVDTHKSIGITLLALAVLRLLWRLFRSPPELPAGMPGWERRAAHAGHWLLYAFMFLMPLTGWIHDSAWVAASTHPNYWFGLFEWPRIGPIMALPESVKQIVHDRGQIVHFYLGYALIGLIAVHVLAVAKHQVLDRMKLLQRMLP